MLVIPLCTHSQALVAFSWDSSMTAAPAAMATVLARLDIAFAIHTGQEMIAVRTLVLQPLVEHVRRYLSRASLWYRIWATDMAH